MRFCSFLPKVLLSLRCCWTLILFSSYIWLTWPPIFYSWHTLTASHIQCQVIVNLQLNYLEQFTHHLLGINHPELDVLQLPVSFPPWVSFALWPFDVNHISPSKITVRLAQVNKPDGLWGCFFILSANVSSDREGRLRSNCWLVKGYNEILNSESAGYNLMFTRYQLSKIIRGIFLQVCKDFQRSVMNDIYSTEYNYFCLL